MVDSRDGEKMYSWENSYLAKFLDGAFLTLYEVASNDDYIRVRVIDDVYRRVEQLRHHPKEGQRWVIVDI